MSVITTADEKREEAEVHIHKAYQCLLVVLDKNTWGHDDFNKESIQKFQTMALKLLEIEREL